MRLLTPRLVVSDVTEDDIDALLAVAWSNPGLTGANEGSDGEPGLFDRDMLERDLAVAAMDPARHPLAVRRRADSAVIGWAEVLDEHPRDLVPWIGLLQMHKDQQRCGYGTEAAQSFVGWATARAARALRVGADEDDLPGLAFWRQQGFDVLERRARRGPGGQIAVLVMERGLAPG